MTGLLKPTTRRAARSAPQTRYVAELAGSITTYGGTKAEAVQRCEEAAHAALTRLDRGTLIGQWNHHIYVVSPEPTGWRYWIDTFSAPGYSIGCPPGSREDAQDSALHALAQTTWTPEVEDDELFVAGLPPKVQGELLTWFGWQRRYAAARAAGYDDAASREMAAQNTVCV